MLRWLSSIGIIGIALILWNGSLAASADFDNSDRYCVIPVKDGAPTAADLYQSSRMVRNIESIPGLPAPVILPSNRNGRWTISQSRKFVPYIAPFPNNSLDQDDWVLEPWSKRVVATARHKGVFALHNGEATFAPIAESTSKEVKHFSEPYLIPSMEISIVTDKGLPFIVGDSELRPWKTEAELIRAGIKGIKSIYDSESLGGVVVYTGDGHFYILRPDDTWHYVTKIDQRNYGNFVDLPKLPGVLYRGSKSALLIKSHISDGLPAFKALTLNEDEGHAASSDFHYSKVADEVLLYERKSKQGPQRVFRLSADGLEAIRGGSFGPLNADKWGEGQFIDLPSLNRVVIWGPQNLFLYDGDAISPIPNSSEVDIGTFARVTALPSIGRILISSEIGLFELTSQFQLVKLDMPFETKGLPTPSLSNWPEAGIALISANDGVWTLDKDLNASKVKGGEHITPDYFDFDLATIRESGERLLVGAGGLFLIIDKQKSGMELCDN